MTQRTFTAIAGAVFLFVALLHAIRLVWRWSAVINGCVVPLWVSWVVVIISLILAFTAFRLERSGR